MSFVFDEAALRAEIVRVWGPAGVHVEVFDAMLARLADLEARLQEPEPTDGPRY